MEQLSKPLIWKEYQIDGLVINIPKKSKKFAFLLMIEASELLNDMLMPVYNNSG